MTELLYIIDSYQREFEAEVIEVQEQAIVLDRTAFYPGGGGQPNDKGVFRSEGQNWQVTSVRRREGKIWHQVEGNPPVVGDGLSGMLDWERRYQIMRTHTAMHVLCGVIWRDYGASVTGGNMEPLRGRMDFEF
jgi:misacylated tRNA(Ala) deacylase